MLLMAIGVCVAAACGFGGCLLLHVPPHAKEMTLALIVAVACAGFSLSIVMLAATSSQSAMAQAGLMASVAHLLGCLIVAGGVMLARLASPVPMLLWMLPMYWATLIGLVVIILGMIKHAPAAQK